MVMNESKAGATTTTSNRIRGHDIVTGRALRSPFTEPSWYATTESFHLS